MDAPDLATAASPPPPLPAPPEVSAAPPVRYVCAECREPLEVTGPPCVDAAAVARSLAYHTQTTGHQGVLRYRLSVALPVVPLEP